MRLSNSRRFPFVLLLALALTLATLSQVIADTDDHGPDQRENQTVTESFFGVQMYGDTRSDTTYNPFALQSNAGTVRVPYTWPNGAPDHPNWYSIDAVLGIAAEQHGGLNVIATLERVPTWAAPDRYGPLYPEHYPTMATFMGQVVERYDGDGYRDAPGSPIITYWELYNEPDRGSSSNPATRWGHNGDLYAFMLQTIYPAMKQANPNAQIVMGGLAYDWFEEDDGPFVRSFIDDVLLAGGCGYFDFMNFHSFPFYANRWTDNQGAGVYEKTAAIRDKLAEYGCYRPIIITESGWMSDEPPWNPSDFEEQARYVPRLFVQAIAADVDMLSWFMLHDPADNYWDYGLVTEDTPPQPKPSLEAYQTAQETLLGLSFTRRYTPEELNHPRMEMYEFDDSDQQRTVYVAWLNPVENEDTATFSFGAPSVIVQTLYGDTSTVYDGDDGALDGQTTVAITAQPRYVFVANEAPTAITLVSFEASADQAGNVTVSWETAAEIDNVGFNVYQSPVPQFDISNAERVNSEMIASQVQLGQGASYSLTDSDVLPGVWYYFLEDVDVSGVGTLHGPVHVDTTVPTSTGLTMLDGTVSGFGAAGMILALLLALALLSRQLQSRWSQKD